MDVIRAGVPRVCRVEMTADMAANEGAICGGIMEVFVEPLGPGTTSADTFVEPSDRQEGSRHTA